MLQAIRDRATGWVAWVIVILLIIPFAFWGIHEYLGGGREPVVAKINDIEITRNQLDRVVQDRLRTSSNRPEGEAYNRYRREVLDSMVSEELLFQSARDQGIRVSDAMIESVIYNNPNFQVDGRFNEEQYAVVLKNNGYSKAGFEAELARSMTIRQYLINVGRTTFMVPKQTDYLAAIQDRKLKLSYVELNREQALKKITISDEQIQAYYNQHPDEFKTAERIKLSYVKVDIADLMKNIDVDEAELRDRYESNKKQYTVPEQRRLAHILIVVDEDTNEAQARERIEAVQSELKQGKDFAALARQHSQDPGSAPMGGDIGVLEAGLLDPAFEQAALALEPGQVSAPVRSEFGYHLIKLVDYRPPQTKSFDQVREQLAHEFQRTQAEDDFFKRVDTLYDLTFQHPDSLQVAADELGLRVQQTDWFDRQGGKSDISADLRVLQAAFSEDVFNPTDITQGVNSRPIELSGAGQGISPRVVIRVSDYEPARLEPLADVRDVIRERLRQQQATEQLQQQAATILEQVQSGKDFTEVASQHHLSVHKTDWVGRSGGDLDLQMREVAFNLPKPLPGKVRYGSSAQLDGDWAVFVVTAYQDGDAQKFDPALRNMLAQTMQQHYGTSLLEALVERLRQQAQVTINETALTGDDDA